MFALFECLDFEAGHEHAVEAVVVEGFECDGADGFDEFVHGIGVDADFFLCVLVHAEGEEVHDVVEVTLPVPFGIEGDREDATREFAGYATLGHLGVVLVDVFCFVEEVEEVLSGVEVDGFFTTLTVAGGLFADVVDGGAVEAVGHDGVASAVFVDVGGAVADPLAGDEDGHGDVEFEFDHFEGSGVAVTEEVADEPTVFGDFFGACAVGDAGGLDDGGVAGLVFGDEAGHGIDEGNEAVLVDGDFPACVALHDVGEFCFCGDFFDLGFGGGVAGFNFDGAWSFCLLVG